VTVLEPDIVRVQFLPDGQPRLDRTWMIAGADGDVPREGRRRDDLAPFSLPAAEVSLTDASARIRTTALDLRIALDHGALTWADASGRVFAADAALRPYAYDRGGRAVLHYLDHRLGERYYGFGETTGPLDKAGMRLRLAPRDALGYAAATTDPLYKHIPFYITFAPDTSVAYGLLYDNLAVATFDLGRERDGYLGFYRYYHADDGDIDCYLLYGPTIEGVVEKLTRLTGRPALPPRWALGYLASGMGYTEDPEARRRLADFIAACTEHDIPCDAFQLSSGYGTDAAGKRYVFAWNAEKMGDARALTASFHAAGMHVAANIKPCLLLSHPNYAALAERGGFLSAAEEDRPEISTFWSEDGSYLDFTAPAGYDWWRAQVRDRLLAHGVDATWNDNNEYEVWDDAARCAGFGAETPIGLLRPVQTLLMLRASRDAQIEHAPDRRPFLISRSGCPGAQRYAQTWSGDNVSSWDTLRWNLPMGLGLSLSGWSATGHDVGGFVGATPDPELLVRWVQCGVFVPRFTIHSWHYDYSATEPWMHPEILPSIRNALQLRYRLLPYLYSLAFEAAQTGHPLMRPLVYAFPGDSRCHAESFDFLLGPNLLVAPVLEPGARTRAVYLPNGTDWYDFWTGARHAGGQTVVCDAPLERIPLFVPAGGILPMGKPMRHVGAEPDDLRVAYVFPRADAGAARFTLYEDDGLTTAYQRGGYAAVTLTVETWKSSLVLSATVTGDYPLPYHAVECILPAGERRTLRGGAEAAPDDHGRRRLIIPI
jgi:alpha-glucosidase